MRAVRLSNVYSFSTVAALLLGVAACGSPANNTALFAAATGGSPASGAAAGSSPASAGSGSASTSGGASNGGQGAAASGGMHPNGGTGGSGNFGGGPSGGAPGSGGGGSPGAGGLGFPVGGGPATNGGGPATGGGFDDCSSLPNNPTYNADNRHCYLAVHDMATFADAKSHCSNMGAHLVTLSNGAENDFVWSLDANEHWIGATDGKGLRETNPGTYSWVDGEPFTYTDWSQGQPNASASTCPDNSGGGTCYEHCGFQWSGGAVPGEWNDRLCAHMIEAVCEWDGPQ